MLNQYQFDIVVLSETWLKDNKQLLQYVQISDYPFDLANMNIGFYLKVLVEYKLRKDFFLSIQLLNISSWKY